MPRKISLTEYLQSHTQRDLAIALNISDMAVSRMVRSDREIYLEFEIDQAGEPVLKAWEKRAVPARKPAAEA